MDFNFLNQKEPKNKGKKAPKKTKFSASIAGAILIFMLLTGLYLIVSGTTGTTPPEVSISEVAQSVSAGTVKTIVVEGDKLTLTYADNSVKTSKKESESSLSQTLFNYGVTPGALAKTDIQVKDETGFLYWLVEISPFLIPAVFILVFFWYISRQVKGAGMQAFTFGQSKARLTDPNDKNNRVTFKDVAGAKEAKEELK